MHFSANNSTKCHSKSLAKSFCWCRQKEHAGYHRAWTPFTVWKCLTWGCGTVALLEIWQSMRWLTKNALSMHWENWQGHLLVSILKKMCRSACVALPFSSTDGSVFICVCMQRSGLPLKRSRKVILFIGFSEGKKDGWWGEMLWILHLTMHKLLPCDGPQGEAVDILKALLNTPRGLHARSSALSCSCSWYMTWGKESNLQ